MDEQRQHERNNHIVDNDDTEPMNGSTELVTSNSTNSLGSPYHDSDNDDNHNINHDKSHNSNATLNRMKTKSKPVSTTCSVFMSIINTKGGSKNHQNTTTTQRRKITPTAASRLALTFRWIVSYSFVGTIFLVLYQFLWTYYLAGEFVPDTTIDPKTGQIVTRRRPERLYKIDQTTHLEVPYEPIDGVLEGHLTLIDIHLPVVGGLDYWTNFNDTTITPYSGVSATFCHVSWTQQQNHPTKNPTFHSLQHHSPLCKVTILKVTNFHEIVQHARRYDDYNNKNINNVDGDYNEGSIQSDTSTSQSMLRSNTNDNDNNNNNNNNNPTRRKRGRRRLANQHQPLFLDGKALSSTTTAVLFHESRSGSTVFANTFTGFAPTQTRVYTDPPPLVTALRACTILQPTNSICDHRSHIQLIQDIFYMLGRTRIHHHHKPQYVFYKLPSDLAAEITTFTTAMPSTPWMYLYRNPIEVLISHFPHYYEHATDSSVVLYGTEQQQEQGHANENTGSWFFNTPSWKNQHSSEPECLQSYYGQQQPNQKQEQQQLQQQPIVLGPPQMSTLFLELIEQKNRTITSLTPEEYCAAYIATLTTAVIQEHERIQNLNNNDNNPFRSLLLIDEENSNNRNGSVATSTLSQHRMPETIVPPHWFINYNQLPFVLWETILPILLVGGENHVVTSDQIDNMLRISKVYGSNHPSNGRKKDSTSSLKNDLNAEQGVENSSGQHWKDDSKMKQNFAPVIIQRAAELFMESLYNELESIRAE